MRNPSPRAGLAMAIVVIVVVITFGCILTALILLGQMHDVEAQIEAAKFQTDLVREQQVEVLKEIGSACDRTGWPLPAAGEDASLPKPDTAKVLQYRDERREKVRATYRASSLGDRATLQDILLVLSLELNRAQDRLDFAKTEDNLAKKALEKAKERSAPIEQIKNDQISKLDADIQGYQERIKTVTEESEKLMNQITQEMTEIDGKKTEEETKHRDGMIKNRNKKNDLVRQIEELKRAEIIEAVLTFVRGKLVMPDVRNRIAFIDLGSQDRVVKGLKFLVGRPGTGDVPFYKAEIEVKRVWPTQSQVSITKIFDDDFPLVHGDLLYNPVYHPRKAPLVVFAGEKRGRSMKYDVDEATRRLREIGTVVDDGKNLVSVDFVIATDGYDTDPLYLRAVELGIPVAPAAEVFRFLGD